MVFVPLSLKDDQSDRQIKFNPVCSTIKLEPTCSAFCCYHTAPSGQTEKKRGKLTVDGKKFCWKTAQKEDFRCERETETETIVANHYMGVSRGPEPSSLAAHIRASSLVEVLVHFLVTDWLFPRIFQSMPAPKNSVQRGRLSFEHVQNIPQPPWIILIQCHSIDWTLGASIIRPTVEQLTQSSQRILPMS